MESDADNLVEARQEREKMLILERLKEVPIVQVACRKAGIGRATYYRWKQEDSLFARACEDALQEGNELINDMSESQIVSLIQEKKLPAIALWLKHHSPTYGAKGRTSTRPIEIDLTTEQKKTVERVLRIGKPKKFKLCSRKRK